MERGHAEALMPMVERVTDGDLAAISRIAVCTGPGSFTGLRIGIAAARGLALGLAVPCIGIPRFDALARGAGAERIALAGRGGTVFVQDFEDGVPQGAPRICAACPPGCQLSTAMVDPIRLAELAADRPAGAPPAPLYLRSADAAPSRIEPPVLLDP